MNTLKISKKDHLRNKSEYQVYEDDLNNYNNRSRSKLQQWNLIQSRLMPNSPKNQNKNINLPLINKNNGEHNSIMQSPSTSSKVVKQVTLAGTNNAYGSQNSPTATKSSRTTGAKEKHQNTNSYNYKIKMQFQVADYNNKSTEDLQKDLKSMRQMLIQLNDLVTSKLNKYQMATFTPKGMAVATQPEKQQQLLYAKIETNSRIIEALQKQIKQIEQRDKQLQEKDYLIQLEQSVNLIMHDMRQKRKEKILQGVAVQKLDHKLIQKRQASLDDEFKMVKVIKHNILYYFKKFNQNNAILSQLDKNYKQLTEKDEKLLKKYNQLSKIAEQKNLLVKSNKNYIENKKTQDQLLAKVDQARKKIQVYKRANLTQCQKIDRQIEKMRKQLMITENKSQQTESSNLSLGKTIQDVIQKNQIGKKVLNSISYKFAEVLLKDSAKDSARNTNKQSLEGISDLKADIQDKSKIFLKPKLKIAKEKQSLNNSTQVSGRYRTLDIEETEQKANDKNIETINFQENKSKQFRIKPSLHIKKRSENDASKMIDSIQLNNDQKANDSQIIYKPKRFQKILSLKKDKESA